MKKIIFTIFVCTIISSCAISDRKMYGDEITPKNELVKIDTVENLRISYIDNEPTTNFFHSFLSFYVKSVLVKPGVHNIKVEYIGDYKFSSGWLKLNFNSGKNYKINYEIINDENMINFFIKEDK